MSKDLLKLVLVCGAIVFAVMFGMELSSSGITSVYGPMDPSAGGVSTPDRLNAETDANAKAKANADATNGRYANEPSGISVEGTDEAAMPRLDHTPAIDKLANSTAEALQSVSRGGIQFVVHLFDKTTK